MGAKKAKKARKTIKVTGYVVECAACGKPFETLSERKMFCSGKCKQRAYRERQK